MRHIYADPLTEICASELCQDAEGTGLSGPCTRFPILSVLHQPFFTGVIGEEGRLGIHPKRVSGTGKKSGMERWKDRQTQVRIKVG